MLLLVDSPEFTDHQLEHDVANTLLMPVDYKLSIGKIIDYGRCSITLLEHRVSFQIPFRPNVPLLAILLNCRGDFICASQWTCSREEPRLQAGPRLNDNAFPNDDVRAPCGIRGDDGGHRRRRERSLQASRRTSWQRE